MAKKTSQSVENTTDANNYHRNNPTNCLKLKIDNLKSFSPLTENQKKFFDSYRQGDYFMALLGSAGTGKSFIALYKALEEVMDKGNPFSTLVIVRSAVQTRDIGFTPGSLEEKMAIYEEPYNQICSTLFGRKDSYQRLKEQGHIEFASTTALRGCSFDNSVVIFDECQNASFRELDTVLTRIGHNSKIIFCGDFSQNDLIKKQSDVSGLPDFLRIAEEMTEFTKVVFTPDDIVRSSLVRNWIIAKEKLGMA
jgi:phosphate starvation-inducible PhoH-like protein